MILRRYIARELLLSLLVTLAVVLSIMVVVMMFRIFRELSTTGLFFQLKAVPVFLLYILPYAILIGAGTSATLAYGRLAADNEIDAMRASGFPVRRILVPAALVGLLLSGVSFYLVDRAAPDAHYRQRTLLRETVLVMLQSPPRGLTYLQIGPHDLRYQDAKGNRLIQPVLARSTADGLTLERFWAQEGRIETPEDGMPRIVLEHPSFRRETPHGVETGSIRSSYLYEIDLEKIYSRPKRPPDMTGPEILEYIADAATPQRRIPDAWTEYYGRFGRPAAVLLLTLLGACVGIVTRKGSRLGGLGAALPTVVGYFVVWVFFKRSGEEGHIPAALAAALPVAALAAALAALAWRIMRK